MENCLVVIDYQKDFVDGSLGTNEAQQIDSAVAREIAKCRDEGWDVVFTMDTHGEDYLETSEGKHLPVVHCVRGTDGHALAEAAHRGRIEKDRVIEKPTFGSQELYELLKREQPGRIELIGLVTDICVLTNAVLAKTACPEAEVLVDASCCAGTTPEMHDAALRVLESLQVEVVNAD